MRQAFLTSFSIKYHDVLVTILRLSLAIIFIWFGALKTAGYNPVYDLIHHSLAPFLADGSGFFFLGVFEVLIGILLLINRFVKLTHTLLLTHLLGTFSVFLFGWSIIFDPRFPILNIQGEFVVKNITLVTAGLVVLAYETRKGERAK